MNRSQICNFDTLKTTDSAEWNESQNVTKASQCKKNPVIITGFFSIQTVSEFKALSE